MYHKTDVPVNVCSFSRCVVCLATRAGLVLFALYAGRAYQLMSNTLGFRSRPQSVAMQSVGPHFMYLA